MRKRHELLVVADPRSQRRRALHRVVARDGGVERGTETRADRFAGDTPQDPGPSPAMRPLRRMRIPTHHATSDVLAGAYPFLAEAGLGSEGVFVGQDAWSGGGFCFDPWVLYEKGVITNPNCLLGRSPRQGKVIAGKVPGHPVDRLRQTGVRAR